MRCFRIALVLVACLIGTPTTASSDGSTTVEIGHNRLNPAEVSVQKGETVTFVNRAEMPGGHSVEADDGSFASPQLEKDQTWDHTFESAGTFAYHIKEHTDAKGVITVK